MSCSLSVSRHSNDLCLKSVSLSFKSPAEYAKALLMCGQDEASCFQDLIAFAALSTRSCIFRSHKMTIIMNIHSRAKKDSRTIEALKTRSSLTATSKGIVRKVLRLKKTQPENGWLALNRITIVTSSAMWVVLKEATVKIQFCFKINIWKCKQLVIKWCSFQFERRGA